MKQATSRIIGSFTLAVFTLSLVFSSVIHANGNEVNETEEAKINTDNNSAFSGVFDATQTIVEDVKVESENADNDVVGVPLEECEITEEGEIIIPEFEPYDMYVNTSFLNVRSGPSLESDVIGKLNINDLVHVMGETESDDTDWLIIYFEGGVDNLGFISSEYTQETAPELDTYNYEWTGKKLNKHDGSVQGPSGKETYYNLNMARVIYYMQQLGYYGYYWVRSDGVKMYTTNTGSYVMCAANLKTRPKGSLVETSLGMGIVVDTGSFVYSNPNQIDVAVNWSKK